MAVTETARDRAVAALRQLFNQTEWLGPTDAVAFVDALLEAVDERRRHQQQLEASALRPRDVEGHPC